MRPQSRAYLYGLATVLLWSTVASDFKLALRHLDPLQLLLTDLAACLLFSTPVTDSAGRRMIGAEGRLQRVAIFG